MADGAPGDGGETLAGLDLMRGRVERTYAFLEDLIEGLPLPTAHKGLLRAHLGEAGEEARAVPRMSAVHVPLLVHASIAGDEEPALPLAAACVAFYLGLDLQDSILDDELSGLWRDRGAGGAELVAASLYGALPQLSLDRLRERGVPPGRLWTLTRQFADALLAVTAGQHEDLLGSDLRDVSLEDCRAVNEARSGAAYALLARAGATLATEDSRRIEAYAAFGLCYGSARQLINDVHGIWAEAASRDILNGRRTFPIAHAMTVLDGDRRERLLELLARARESAEHHDEVRETLSAAGSARYADSIVWFYREQARKHLAAASPGGPAGRELRALLDGVSILSQASAERA